MYKASFRKHSLRFKKAARTSRSELHTHEVFYLRLQRVSDRRVAYGEAAPLKGLSIDDVPHFEARLHELCELVNAGCPVQELPFAGFPSMEFAFETALLALRFEEPFRLFDTAFYTRHQPVRINGLVWMNDTSVMLNEALEKAAAGFDVIKFKVGALDFDAECRMLEAFRKRYNAFRIELRLDANGAFKPGEVLEQLNELSRFGIHSIEQPVKAGQWGEMEEVCARSKIAVALDEELIGVDAHESGGRMLDAIRPACIILKPTLLGGLAKGDAWIRAASARNIGWWATSALESNIGLNAIAQWASTYPNRLAQGLGTGGLYTNNIASPLMVEGGHLYYGTSSWDEAALAELFGE